MEKYLAVIAVLAIGYWRLSRYLRGLRYVNARIRARKMKESQTLGKLDQS
jgi:hypothetical protein